MPSISGLVRLKVWSWCSSTTGTRYLSNSGTQCLRLPAPVPSLAAAAASTACRNEG
ncbi:MAG: hypothetical protein QM811_31990 [Pirellulales bacterium]